MTPAAAGASGLPLRRFLPAVVVGATVWSAVHVTAGFLLREAAEQFEKAFGIAGWVVLAVVVVAGVVGWRVRRRRAQARRAAARETVAVLADERRDAA
ncbi:hypothetical protein [Pseudonocardia sp. ICBG601]|nr:hypothetical protein [Pseudonocardia sp. ICBG601]